MLDEKYIPYNYAPILNKKNETDAYSYYYGHKGNKKLKKNIYS
jgi:hypothetical protein